MQLIAMLTMLIDHIGVVFFPEDSSWRIIGRLAFPLYAYLLVQGYHRTRNIKKYMVRLSLLAIIAQLPFSLLFSTWELNAIVTLWVGLLTIYALDVAPRRVEWKFAIVAGAVFVSLLIPFDYGIYGLLLILIYRYAPQKLWLVWHLALNIIIGLLLFGWVIQQFSIFSTILLVYMPLVVNQLEKSSVPRWLWRSFYPAHLAVLWVLQQVMLHLL
ncbi:TraX family protein [Paenibacillus yanchengensis]|uniref:TraX family protein n=1 Tax=Paenibacillus yanchengensis TaxID=2035833 RepID=A0ABW4YGC3_9BACL